MERKAHLKFLLLLLNECEAYLESRGTMKFDVIIADFPYNFSDRLSMSDVARGAAANYKTMSKQDLLSLQLNDIASADGAILAMWVPSSMLQDGLDLMRNYGFQFKQTYIWVKNKKEPLKDLRLDLNKAVISAMNLGKLPGNEIKKEIKNFALAISDRTKSFIFNDSLGFGLGRLFRQSHEICLLGINNTKIYKKLKNKSQRSVSFAENLKHSSKPENLQDSLDLMFPTCSKVELFARRQRPGFLCLGNEAPMSFGENINVSLKKLKNLSQLEYDEIISCNDEKKLFDLWGKISYEEMSVL